MLRFDCMMKFYEDKDFSKAAEYATLALKSADLAEQADKQIHEQLKKIRQICYHIIAGDYLEKGDYEGALTFFKEAVQAEPYGQGYYKIGLCLDHLKEIDDAMLYYAMAELKGEENVSEAKSRIEILYKALHNQTLIGIDKIYNKARDLMDENPKT
jgi:tetratricopeptide (TPR) repeat protein